MKSVVQRELAWKRLSEFNVFIIPDIYFYYLFGEYSTFSKFPKRLSDSELSFVALGILFKSVK